ncbi:MAG TPA: hypothetical protein K8V30_01080 [Metalysinibacillus jejuensis]|uniref:Phage shock protein B n=1 Tax=Metalysinibacillus jejuensis TaxID=914327 RepID=A0A921T4E9_9BACL|nr:hypothetical protein [Metalysinibacillus jejuensis]HJH10281.1 hypothetical protein [Metalysinibacillus jejuensis]
MLVVMLVSLLPLLIFIAIAVIVMRIFKRAEQRANERLEIERVRAQELQRQVAEMKLRVHRIEEILEEI